MWSVKDAMHVYIIGKIKASLEVVFMSGSGSKKVQPTRAHVISLVETGPRRVLLVPSQWFYVASQWLYVASRSDRRGADRVFKLSISVGFDVGEG